MPDWVPDHRCTIRNVGIDSDAVSVGGLCGAWHGRAAFPVRHSPMLRACVDARNCAQGSVAAAELTFSRIFLDAVELAVRDWNEPESVVPASPHPQSVPHTRCPRLAITGDCGSRGAKRWCNGLSVSSLALKGCTGDARPGYTSHMSRDVT